MGARQHTVPQSYLEAFAVDRSSGKTPVFWVYDKAGGEPRPQTPVNTTVERHFYSLDDDETIEGQLSKEESLAKPILDRWCASKAVIDSDPAAMARYVALLLTRVPRMVEAMKEMHRASLAAKLKSTSPEEIRRAIEKTGSGLSLEKAQAYFANPQAHFELGFEGKKALLDALSQTKTFAEFLQNMHWHLCTAPAETFFITGDAPTCLFVPMSPGRVIFGGGIARSSAQVSLPISTQIALFITWKEQRREILQGRPLVTEINKRTAHVAERYVISPFRTDEIASLVAERAAASRSDPKIDAEAVEESFRRGRNL